MRKFRLLGARASGFPVTNSSPTSSDSTTGHVLRAALAPLALRSKMHGVQTFAEFWPYYLREHSRPATRALHFVGTTLSLLLVLSAIALRRPALVLAALVCGYAFAWVGHFFVEHNRPATFKYPLWSFRADFKMWALALTGRLGAELQRAGVK